MTVMVGSEVSVRVGPEAEVSFRGRVHECCQSKCSDSISIGLAVKSLEATAPVAERKLYLILPDPFGFNGVKNRTPSVDRFLCRYFKLVPLKGL